MFFPPNLWEDVGNGLRHGTNHKLDEAHLSSAETGHATGRAGPRKRAEPRDLKECGLGGDRVCF